MVIASVLATSTGFADVPFYRFTIPHLVIVGLTLLVLGVAAFTRLSSLFMLVTMTVALSVTLITAVYVAAQWPGGNDGPGITWFYLIGGLCMINVAASIVFGVSALRDQLHSLN